MNEAITNAGYGQQTPYDTNDPVAVTIFIVRQMMAAMDTAKLVKVIAVYPGEGTVPAAGTVDVQPLVSQIDGANQTTPHGTVFRIPFLRPGGATGTVVSDPVVGDVGQVVACDRDITAVRNTKAVSPPGSNRRFRISDGIYVGQALGASPTQALFFSATGAKLFDENGNSIETSAGGVTITPKTGQDVVVDGGGVVNLDLTVGQDLQVDGSAVVTGGLRTETSIQIASGAVLTRVLQGSVTTSFGGTLGAFLAAQTMISIPGARPGDAVMLGMSAPGNNVAIYKAWVSANDVVTLQIANPATTLAIAVSSQTYNVLVFGHS